MTRRSSYAGRPKIWVKRCEHWIAPVDGAAQFKENRL
jgi:hypothetical protein